ncbi:S1 family peptidase [Allostreptomyces psammosilenae]|uniref:Serine protease n=1 Tax=Allostreptomyces psammosilenae TaxID=1892865 RepID=A0A853A2W8_9ACTN|nr:serine protease [Allostreptomyces psammosilenae]NYI05081.1 hypothetical protein [Allostreptomyces psammosilenae]
MGDQTRIPADHRAAEETWRVRIRSVDGGILGAGILLGTDAVLTCAHVVAPADRRVLVDLAGGGTPVGARVREDGWVPELDDHCGDVALLRLERPQRADGAARLYRLPPSGNRRVRMYGYPHGLDDGMYVQARLAGTAGPRWEWVQMDPERPGELVQRGFSGAAVTDQLSGHVIGMVVGFFHDGSSLGASFMIPTETILRHLPQVRRWVDGEEAVDVSLASRPGARPPDPDFAARIAGWLGGREDASAVRITVVEPTDATRSTALRRAIGLAVREPPPGSTARAVPPAAATRGTGAAAGTEPGLPPSTVPPVGSLDLAIDVAGRTVGEVATRVADRMVGRLDASSPTDRIRVSAVPLTILVDGVDDAVDPMALLGLLGLLVAQGCRLLLVFHRSTSPSLRHAEAELVVRPALARIADLLERVAAVEEEVRRRRAYVARRVADVPPAPDTAFGLRIGLTTLRQADPLRDHRRLVEDLPRYERAALAARARAEETGRRLEELLGRRDELRGRLGAYQAMLADHGRAECLEAATAYRDAHHLLYDGRCDLAAADAAVAAFVRAVEHCVRRCPDPGTGATR